MEVPQEGGWIQAMNNEKQASKKNDTLEITPLLEGKKPIRLKWIYKTKFMHIREIDRLKARTIFKFLL